ncbi:MAG: hypothetical protein G8D81_00150 [gamma proteobacterium symbiont of Clathrolucina costata]|uniref:Uncharacterized protein n=1 Tax=Candidatus Thiodiazotropha taylori TaxID=2792791 RepID=A0A9E4NQ66_9GAMM|nr:hypothetical protein [Candidatus Thiodiazotropha taylori]MCW4239193.1 hypothetical protein [Candidatus Thiodiazotropha endolucinida]
MNSDRSSADIATAVSTLNQKYGAASVAAAEAVAVDVGRIVKALEEFMECVRYLNTRRSTSAILKLDSEAAVQDALYLMLRPWVLDLIPENPTDRVAASRYTIKDFLCRSAKTVIEAKYVRDSNHGKYITKELHDDIETYRHHPACRHLIFFIYDPDALIPDRAALERQIAVERVYDGVPLTCHLVVKP